MEGSVENINLKQETEDCQIENLIGVPEIKTEVDVNSGKDSDFKLNTYPIVVVERNIDLERALGVKIEKKLKSKEGKDHEERKSKSGCDEDFPKELATTSTGEHVIISHVGSAGLTMFVCAECNKCYNGQDSLQAHICNNYNPESNVSENISKSSQYICNLCGKSYKIRQKLQTHKDKIHKGHPFFCSSCKLTFNSKTLLAEHCKIHLHIKKQICHICKQEFKLLAEHVASQHGNYQKKFSCSECGSSFKTRGELRIHLTVHFTEKNYICTYCKSSFKSRHLIESHLKYCNNQLRATYTCDYCSKVLTSKHSLRSHMFTKHSNSRPFSCNHCKETFKVKKCLLIHTQTHTGLKPYTCSICDKKFAQTAHLKRHERLHTGVKPYLCKLCGKSFRDSSNFKIHQIFHSGLRPFKCTECQKGFTQPSHLKTHMKIHSEERPYVCNICGDAFKQKLVLKSHMFRHSEVKPYNCEGCGISFIQLTHFKRHKCKVVNF